MITVATLHLPESIVLNASLLFLAATSAFQIARWLLR